MSFAVLTDIHGYGEALSDALMRINALGIKKVLCLGDIVDGGEDNEACIAMIRDSGIEAVRGNHDEYHALQLPPVDEEWLRSLPLTMEFQNWHMVHDSPRGGERKIKDQYEAWNCFDETTHKKIMVGHSHVPAIYEYDEQNGKTSNNVTVHDYECVMRADCRYLVSVPSLAYNRAVCVRPGFCIVDMRSVMFVFLDLQPLIS